MVDFLFRMSGAGPEDVRCGNGPVIRLWSDNIVGEACEHGKTRPSLQSDWTTTFLRDAQATGGSATYNVETLDNTVRSVLYYLW